MNFNFLLTECTFLRYFIPLIIEGNKRGISSVAYVGTSGKYTCPSIPSNMATIQNLSKEYNFSLKEISEADKVKNEIFFCVEGVGLKNRNLKQNNKVCSLTYMTDYFFLYDSYIHDVNQVIFPSLKYAQFGEQDKKSDKNIYLGSPKYGVELNSGDILNKYNIDKESKIALVLAPKTRDINNINLQALYQWVENLGYTVVTKTRGKDPLPDYMRSSKYFEDESWYPHTTMELISIADFVINFSSTAIKECVLMNTPLINFHIKPFDEPHTPFLYEYDYCKQLNKDCSFDDFKTAVNDLVSQDHSSSFQASVRDNLFDVNNVCKKIVDAVLE